MLVKKNLRNVDIMSRLVKFTTKNPQKHLQYRHNWKSAYSYKLMKHPIRDGNRFQFSETDFEKVRQLIEIVKMAFFLHVFASPHDTKGVVTTG